MKKEKEIKSIIDWGQIFTTLYLWGILVKLILIPVIFILFIFIFSKWSTDIFDSIPLLCFIIFIILVYLVYVFIFISEDLFEVIFQRYTLYFLYENDCLVIKHSNGTAKYFISNSIQNEKRLYQISFFLYEDDNNYSKNYIQTTYKNYGKSNFAEYNCGKLPSYQKFRKQDINDLFEWMKDTLKENNSNLKISFDDFYDMSFGDHVYSIFKRKKSKFTSTKISFVSKNNLFYPAIFHYFLGDILKKIILIIIYNLPILFILIFLLTIITPIVSFSFFDISSLKEFVLFPYNILKIIIHGVFFSKSDPADLTAFVVIFSFGIICLVPVLAAILVLIIITLIDRQSIISVEKKDNILISLRQDYIKPILIDFKKIDTLIINNEFNKVKLNFHYLTINCADQTYNFLKRCHRSHFLNEDIDGLVSWLRNINTNIRILDNRFNFNLHEKNKYGLLGFFNLEGIVVGKNKVEYLKDHNNDEICVFCHSDLIVSNASHCSKCGQEQLSIYQAYTNIINFNLIEKIGFYLLLCVPLVIVFPNFFTLIFLFFIMRAWIKRLIEHTKVFLAKTIDNKEIISHYMLAKRKLKKNLLIGFSFIIILCVLFLTNPSAKDFKSFLISTSSERLTDNQLYRGILINTLNKIDEYIILESFITRRNHYLYTIYIVDTTPSKSDDNEYLSFMGVGKNFFPINLSDYKEYRKKE